MLTLPSMPSIHLEGGEQVAQFREAARALRAPRYHNVSTEGLEKTLEWRRARARSLTIDKVALSVADAMAGHPTRKRLSPPAAPQLVAERVVEAAGLDGGWVTPRGVGKER